MSSTSCVSSFQFPHLSSLFFFVDSSTSLFTFLKVKLPGTFPCSHACGSHYLDAACLPTSFVFKSELGVQALFLTHLSSSNLLCCESVSYMPLACCFFLLSRACSCVGSNFSLARVVALFLHFIFSFGSPWALSLGTVASCGSLGSHFSILGAWVPTLSVPL